MVSDDADYSLARPDVLELFEDGDEDIFLQVMGRFYEQVAQEWGCRVTVSGRRLIEALNFYVNDIQRTLEFGMEPKDATGLEDELKADDLPAVLDHFKHASFLAFWLRRMVPINEMWALDENGDTIAETQAPLTPKQKHFLSFGNEYCALLAGLHIALNHELQRLQNRNDKLSNDDLHALVAAQIAAVELPERFVYEFPRLLKHKNISSHALYMTYCSLFDPLTGLSVQRS